MEKGSKMDKFEKIHTDYEIINAFFCRDVNAVSMLALKYDKYLLNIALNILNNYEDSEECVNDTFLKIWNNIPPDNPNNFKAYILKILKNTALDMYKKRTRKKRIPSEYLVSFEEISEYVPQQVDFEDSFNRKLLKELIDEHIQSLSKQQQYIFVCRYYFYDSINNIAKSLHVSKSTIFNELNFIRKELKEKLIKEEMWL